MIPILFEIGPIIIYSFGTMLVVAFLVDYQLLKHELKRRNKSEALAGDIVFWAALGGILGSKVYYMFENYRLFVNDPIGMIFSGSGLVFLGGLMGGMLAVTVLIKKRGESWLEFADIVAPLLILGYAIGRVGCFLVGDDYGIVSDLPWAIAFPNGVPPTLVPVHPTQLYEFTMGIIIFTILWRLRVKTSPHGQLFFIYLILAGWERFLIEFIRTNTQYFIGLSGAQVISIMMVGIGSYLFYKTYSTSSESGAAETSS